MCLIKLAHCLPPERAHNLGLWALQHGLLPAKAPVISPLLSVNVLGLSFESPIGLAAGFDKNAAAVNSLLSQGFGFVEAGTVTPKAQPGNPRPRIFRLPKDKAVINRLGFNNEGLAHFIANIQMADRTRGVVGANIGKNKDSTDAVADYIIGLKAVYPYADYITINISSPNTQGLRALQQREALSGLLSAIDKARGECFAQYAFNKPLLLKVAPDLTPLEMEDIADLVISFGIDGMIISNTTVSRPSTLKSRCTSEMGGLSGKPLLTLSTEALRQFYVLTKGNIPLIGVGGVSSAEDAYAKIRAGASLVQLYTALVYRGFGVVREIQKGLVELLQRDGFAHVQDAVGADAKAFFP